MMSYGRLLWTTLALSFTAVPGCGPSTDAPSDACAVPRLVDATPSISDDAVVGLVMRDGGDTTYCTGTQVGERHIVTAGHCVVEPMATPFEFTELPPEAITVYYGQQLLEWDSGRDDPTFIATREVSAVHVHPDGTPDLAVLELSEPGPVDGLSLDVTLPLDAGTPLRLVGYGMHVPGAPQQWDGRRRHGDTISAAWDDEVIDAIELALGEAIEATFGQSATEFFSPWFLPLDGRGERANICSGDSGGAALRRVEDRDVLVGVISFSIDCQSFGFVGDLRRSRDFLAEHVAVEPAVEPDPEPEPDAESSSGGEPETDDDPTPADEATTGPLDPCE